VNCPHCAIALPPDARYCAGCGREIPGVPARAPASNHGLLLAVIVAAVVCGVMMVGIVAAIAIPNLLNAIDRGKQKRSIADMQHIGAAMEEYRAAHGSYPTARDVETLRPQLVPTFVPAMPAHDGWGRPFNVESDGASYTLSTGGKDGTVEGCDGGATASFDDAICLTDGELTQWPGHTRR
jgi:type II secretory pathway pseudopilin PulG